MKKLSWGLKLVLLFLAGTAVFNVYFLDQIRRPPKPAGFYADLTSLQFCIIVTALLILSIIGIMRLKFWGYNLSIFTLGMEVGLMQFWPPLPKGVQEFGSYIPLSTAGTWLTFTILFYIAVGLTVWILSKNKKKLGKSGF